MDDAGRLTRVAASGHAAGSAGMRKVKRVSSGVDATSMVVFT
jgi:hypothetical protein